MKLPYPWSPCSGTQLTFRMNNNTIKLWRSSPIYSAMPRVFNCNNSLHNYAVFPLSPTKFPQCLLHIPTKISSRNASQHSTIHTIVIPLKLWVHSTPTPSISQTIATNSLPDTQTPQAPYHQNYQTHSPSYRRTTHGETSSHKISHEPIRRNL